MKCQHNWRWSKHGDTWFCSNCTKKVKRIKVVYAHPEGGNGNVDLTVTDQHGIVDFTHNDTINRIATHIFGGEKDAAASGKSTEDRGISADTFEDIDDS